VIPLPLDEAEPLGRLVRAGWTDHATGIRIDSRLVEEGDLFVAVGAGIDFGKHAFARGASAVLEPDDAFAALAALGSAVRSRSRARVVGITGSTGKTSTKDILAAFCAPHARTVAAAGGHNNELGLPLTLASIEPDTEIVVAEMGMRGIGQIAELCAAARPHIGVITGIGPVHLELLGSVERVAEAKAEIVGALPAGGVAVAPVQAPELDPFLRRDDVELRRFGPGGDASVVSFEPRARDAEAVFDVRGRELSLRVNCSPTTRSACRSTVPRRARTGSRSRAGAGRKRRCPAKVSSSTTPTTPIRSRWRPRSGTSRIAPPAAVASQSSGTWPSWARTHRPITSGSGGPRPPTPTCSWLWGSWLAAISAREWPRSAMPPPSRTRLPRSTNWCGPVTLCS
jgi:hypothetical protein